MALRDGGPPTIDSVGRPQSRRGIEARLGRWTESEEINLTLVSCAFDQVEIAQENPRPMDQWDQLFEVP